VLLIINFYKIMIVFVDYSCLHHYKNTKEMLLKTNATICFDKMWRFQHLHVNTSKSKSVVIIHKAHKECRETIVIKENYYYCITVYNQHHIILSFYNFLNIENINYNLYI
jgi:hypothetical protein